MQLRPYQTAMIEGVDSLWARGARNVLVRAPTGAGKTLCSMTLVAREAAAGVAGVVQAHRAELVAQLSCALAGAGVRHDLTVNSATRRAIVDQHLSKFGRSYFDPRSPWSVESVDTAIKRRPRDGVKLVVVDEAHHCASGNKWVRGVNMYEDAKVLGFTATPCRTDGQGLNRASGGIFDAMVDGPHTAELMREGYLCEYDIKVAVPADLHLEGVAVSASGELNMTQAAAAMHASSSIVGDAVDAYLKHCPGKLCICFAVDIEHAREITRKYLAAGVMASMLSGSHSETERAAVLGQFARGDLRVLVNVDLFGEGFDVPGVEVVQMCRPTASFSLFTQQVGRALRVAVAPEVARGWAEMGADARRAAIAASAKPRALILDHVGNMLRTYKVGDTEHVGPPEMFVGWSLDGRTKRRSAGDAIPTRTCTGCFMPFERYYGACPFCGLPVPAPEPGSVPAHVDGNMYDYAPELLAQMRAEVARVDGPPLLPAGLSGPAKMAATARWNERQQGQQALRATIALWAGAPSRTGRPDADLQREFYLRFGVDVLGAMALGAAAAEELRLRVMENIYG